MAHKPKKPARRGTEDLTPLELTLMQILWDRGDATAAEVRDALQQDQPLADTTIHTVLANMRKKGCIEPIPTVERALRFAPRIQREQVAHRSLKRLLGDFYGGSAQRLMAHLISEGSVDEAELAAIRKMLQSQSKGEGKKS